MILSRSDSNVNIQTNYFNIIKDSNYDSISFYSFSVRDPAFMHGLRVEVIRVFKDARSLVYLIWTGLSAVVWGGRILQKEAGECLAARFL